MRHRFKNFSTEIPKLSDVRETFFSESILMKQGLDKKKNQSYYHFGYVIYD